MNWTLKILNFFLLIDKFTKLLYNWRVIKLMPL